MAWKEIAGTNNNRIWAGEGLPNIEQLLIANRGFYINIPDIVSGIGTIISYDSLLPYTLRDDNLLQYVYYLDGTSYPFLLLADGHCIGLEFTNIQLINKIKLYTAVNTGSVINTNTFYIMSSVDGVNWNTKDTISSDNIIFENMTTYGIINFNLSEPISTRYVVIRSLNNFSITNTNPYLRELRCYSPDGNFGIESDEYRDNLTGKVYKKINNIWDLIYTPTPIPAHLIGSSVTPPSGVGLPVGSLYFKRS